MKLDVENIIIGCILLYELIIKVEDIMAKITIGSIEINITDELLTSIFIGAEIFITGCCLSIIYVATNGIS